MLYWCELYIFCNDKVPSLEEVNQTFVVEKKLIREFFLRNLNFMKSLKKLLKNH